MMVVSGVGVMRLPDDAVGITDLISWRECGRRMHFGMSRHTAAGEHPEAIGPTTAYGSAFHDVVAYAEEHGCDDDEAIQFGFDRYAAYLEPEDLKRLLDDLVVYRHREPLGVRTIAVEQEFRIPLFVHEGTQIYFRGKLDRLYQRMDDPSLFLHVDYKTSRWPKSHEEVQTDLQLWAYNYAIHELQPEIGHLLQLYDQLNYGVEPTSKNDEQRALMKQWLIRQTTALLNDESYGEDGLLEHRHNQWCAWCFTPGTMIAVPGGGLVAIADLVVGSEVVGSDGTTAKVTACASRPANEIVRVRTLGSPFFEVTPDHLVLASEGPDGGREWVEAQRLTTQSYLWARLPAPRASTRLTGDEMTLLGWYLAEGHTTNRSSSFTLHVDEEDFGNEICAILRRSFGIEHVNVSVRENTRMITAHDFHLASWLTHFGGSRSEGKRIHPGVFGNGSGLMPILVAMWRGDGSTPTGNTSQTSYTTASLTLAWQVQLMLLREGLAPSWSTREPHTFGKAAQALGFRQRAYALTLNGLDALEMARHVGGRAKPTRSSRGRRPVITPVGWVGYPVMEVERSAYDGLVYDVEVPGPESLIVVGMVGAHNCPIMGSCQVIPQLTDFALAEIAALGPANDKDPVGDPAPYVALLERVTAAQSVLDAYAKKMKGVIRDMPAERREALGYGLTQRSSTQYPPDALRLAHEVMGDRFYEALQLSQTAIERLADPRARGLLQGLGLRRVGSVYPRRRKT